MEAVQRERERPQQRVEDREQAGGVDVLDRADALELRDFVHQIQMVEALDAVQVALTDRIDPDPAGPSERLRAAAFPNRDLRRAGRLRDRPAAPGIGRRASQVVQVADQRQLFWPVVEWKWPREKGPPSFRQPVNR